MVMEVMELIVDDDHVDSGGRADGGTYHTQTHTHAGTDTLPSGHVPARGYLL